MPSKARQDYPHPGPLSPSVFPPSPTASSSSQNSSSRVLASSQVAYTAGGTPIRVRAAAPANITPLHKRSSAFAPSPPSPNDRERTPRRRLALPTPPTSGQRPNSAGNTSHQVSSPASAPSRAMADIDVRASRPSQRSPIVSPTRLTRAQSYHSSSAKTTPPQATDSAAPSRQSSVAAKPRRSDVHAQDIDRIRSSSRAGIARRSGDPEQSHGSERRVAQPPPSSLRRGPRPDGSGSPTRRSLSRRNSQRDEEAIMAMDSSGGSHGTLRADGRSMRSPSPDDVEFPRASGSRDYASSRARANRGDVVSVSGKDSDRHQRDVSEETVLHSQAPTGDTATRADPVKSGSRRRRYASDAQASDIPTFDYEGRAGTGSARLSVDTSSAQRHLAAAARARNTINGGSAFSASARSEIVRGQRRWDEPSDVSAESLRLRKTSQSSSGSLSRQRPSSRLSVGARSAVPDLFDQALYLSPTLSHRSLRPDLPPEAIDRVRALRMRRDALQQSAQIPRKDIYASAVEDLRAQIDDIDISGSAMPDSSRSSSVISSAPRSRAPASLFEQRLAGSERAAPHSEPRRMGELRKERVADHRSLMLATANGTDVARRYLPQSVSEQPPSTPDVGQRPGSRFSVASRGVTPGPVLNTASSANGRAVTAHEKNLLVSFDIFERNFAPTSTASPNSSRNTTSASLEMVEKARSFLNTVTILNSGLRNMAQYVIQREIEAELGTDADSAARTMTEVLKDLDQAVASLMKYSDNQVRSLGDLLSAVTRMDKDRAKLRVASTLADGDSGGPPSSRPESRLSRLGTPSSQFSPSRRGVAQSRRQMGLDEGSLSHPRNHRDGLPVTDGEPAGSFRREPRSAYRLNNAAETEMSAYRNSATHGSLRGSQRPSRDYADDSTGAALGDDPSGSPTMGVNAANRRRASASIHGRSVSELSPGPLSPERGHAATEHGAGVIRGERGGSQHQGEIQRRRTMLVQRPSSTTIRPPPTLSPRRPKLSDPSVATAVAVSSNSHAMRGEVTSAIEPSGSPRANEYRLSRRLSSRRSSAVIGAARGAAESTSPSSTITASRSPAGSSTFSQLFGTRQQPQRHSIAAWSPQQEHDFSTEPPGSERRARDQGPFSQTDPSLADQDTAGRDEVSYSGDDIGRDDDDGDDGNDDNSTTPVSSTPPPHPSIQPPSSARNALRSVSQTFGKSSGSRASSALLKARGAGIFGGGHGSGAADVVDSTEGDVSGSAAAQGSEQSMWAARTASPQAADQVL